MHTDSFAYLFDIYPTLCELIGIETPDSVEGMSLVPAMNKPDMDTCETMYFAYWKNQRAVKDKQYKLVEYVVNGINNMTQLFDLKNDPWEMFNLAFNPDQVDRVKAHRKELVDLCDALGDTETRLGEKFWAGIEWA